MNAIIFDTETNGKPKSWKAKMADVNNWPRITQLAWQKVNIETGDVLSSHETLIYPDGWTVPTEKFFIDNNMSTERCEAEGVQISSALSKLIEDMNDSEFIVAHNMNFDMNVTGAEMIRIGMSSEKPLKKICTMQSTIYFCNLLPLMFGKPKFPKLEELHVKLFGKNFEGAHDAMSDVIACKDCFLELVKRKIIKL